MAAKKKTAKKKTAKKAAAKKSATKKKSATAKKKTTATRKKKATTTKKAAADPVVEPDQAVQRAEKHANEGGVAQGDEQKDGLLQYQIGPAVTAAEAAPGA